MSHFCILDRYVLHPHLPVLPSSSSSLTFDPNHLERATLVHSIFCWIIPQTSHPSFVLTLISMIGLLLLVPDPHPSLRSPGIQCIPGLCLWMQRSHFSAKNCLERLQQWFMFLKNVFWLFSFSKLLAFSHSCIFYLIWESVRFHI